MWSPCRRLNSQEIIANTSLLVTLLSVLNFGKSIQVNSLNFGDLKKITILHPVLPLFYRYDLLTITKNFIALHQMVFYSDGETKDIMS
jgi:hypothetical protein